MIIDCHAHLGRNGHISATADQLIASMDQAGIDKALVFAGSINDCPNDYMLEQIAPYRRMYGVGAFRRLDNTSSFREQSEKQMDDLVSLYEQKKIVAVKFYTGYDHYFPADVNRELSRLEKVGCPAIFHSGDCLSSIKKAKLKYAHPLHIDEVAVDHPNMNFIIAHVGFPWVRDTAEVCYKNKNVFTDISGFVYGDFTEEDNYKFNMVMGEFVDIASPQKVLFGTDFPISSQKSYVGTINYHSFLNMKSMTDNALQAFKL